MRLKWDGGSIYRNKLTIDPFFIGKKQIDPFRPQSRFESTKKTSVAGWTPHAAATNFTTHTDKKKNPPSTPPPTATTSAIRSFCNERCGGAGPASPRLPGWWGTPRVGTLPKPRTRVSRAHGLPHCSREYLVPRWRRLRPRGKMLVAPI